MCGRFTLRTPASKLAVWFAEASLALDWPQTRPRYNIAPTQSITCVFAKRPHVIEIGQFHWGLIPSWSKDKKAAYKLINARSETAHEKPSFRSAFKQRRCLIVADGFYEWKRDGASKRPFHISMKDDSPFCFAGLWEIWSDDSERIESATILTTTANRLMAEIHDRMPVILPREHYRFWLDGDNVNADAKEVGRSNQPSVSSETIDRLRQLLRPYPAEPMKTTEVTTHVNSPRNEDANCLLPIRINDV